MQGHVGLMANVQVSAGPQLTNDRRRHPCGQGSVATRSELMKTLWILAAAATFAACHNRSDEETGAAPNRGDTTAVSGYDTTAANPNAKVDTTTTTQPTAPSADTSTTAQPTAPADTSMGAPSADTTAQPTAPSAGYDTTSAQPAPQPTAPSAGYDTTSTAVPPPTTDTTMTHDSASTQR
jgi:hypothetical protein